MTDFARKLAAQMRSDADRIETLYSVQTPEEKALAEKENEERDFYELMADINKRPEKDSDLYDYMNQND